MDDHGLDGQAGGEGEPRCFLFLPLTHSHTGSVPCLGSYLAIDRIGKKHRGEWPGTDELHSADAKVPTTQADWQAGG